MAFADAQASAVIVSGKVPATVKAVGAVTKGDALGFSGGWKRALATTGSVVQMRCVAAEDGVDGQDVSVYFEQAVLEGRLSGMTAGGALYVAEGTSNGMYTQTAPTTTGDANTIVGYALTTTKAVITPNANVDSVA